MQTFIKQEERKKWLKIIFQKYTFTLANYLKSAFWPKLKFQLCACSKAECNNKY